MTDSTETSTDKRAEILGQVWMTYGNDDEFQDFVSYNDLGLPLAYAISTDIVALSARAKMFIDETWDLFLAAVGVEDTGFDSLEEILGSPID